MTTRGRLLVLLGVVGCLGERPGANGGAEWIGEERQIGDTLVVTTVSGQVWRRNPAVVEELRIGVLEGAQEYQLGDVVALTVDDQGRIYVFDSQVPSLRRYSEAGVFIDEIGREGSGPGEYGDASLGLAITSDGRVLLRDPRNGRVNLYDSAGAPLESWPIASGLYTADATILDDRDHLWVRILAGPPPRNAPWPISLLHLDEKGAVVDTVAPPSLAGEPSALRGQFAPEKKWTFSPRGYFVVGVNDAYSFELHPPAGGTVTRIVRRVEPVRVQPGEKVEWEAYFDWLIERQGDSFTIDDVSIPDRKPLYQGFFVADDGRIWVRRHTLAVEGDPSSPAPDGRPSISWREPLRYDVFEPEGRFLGSVDMPERARVMFARGDQVWGTQRGELDETYVVRWRLAF